MIKELKKAFQVTKPFATINDRTSGIGDRTMGHGQTSHLFSRLIIRNLYIYDPIVCLIRVEVHPHSEKNAVA